MTNKQTQGIRQDKWQNLEANGVGIDFSCKGLGVVQVDCEAAQLGVPMEPGKDGVGCKQLCLLQLEVNLKLT